MLRHPDFRAGDIDTNFIARYPQLTEPPLVSERVLAAAAWCLMGAAAQSGNDPWNVTDSFRLAGRARRTIAFVVDGKRVAVAVPHSGEGLPPAFRLADGSIAVVDDGETFVLEPHDPLYDAETEENVSGSIAAPMPGRVVAVHVVPGQKVRRGDALLVLEAMKMEHTLTAPRDGVVEAVGAAAGDQIAEGTVLVRFVGENA